MFQALLSIPAGDALAHGLPPVSLSLDATGSGLWGSTFPAPRTFVSLSGPPGGPLFFAVSSAPPGASDQVRAVMAASAWGRDPIVQPGGPVEVNGISRASFLFFAGQQNAATVGCVVEVPVGEAMLSLVFGHGGAPGSVPDGASVARHPSLHKVLSSFSAVWRPDAPPAPRGTPGAGGAARPGGGASTLALLAELRELMVRTGSWAEQMPSAQDYQRSGDYERQLWSLQSALQSLEGPLRALRGPRRAALAGGVASVLGVARDGLRRDPRGRELVGLLDAHLGA